MYQKMLKYIYLAIYPSKVTLSIVKQKLIIHREYGIILI